MITPNRQIAPIIMESLTTNPLRLGINQRLTIVVKNMRQGGI